MTSKLFSAEAGHIFPSLQPILLVTRVATLLLFYSLGCLFYHFSWGASNNLTSS
jgi:hypothetical protein